MKDERVETVTNNAEGRRIISSLSAGRALKIVGFCQFDGVGELSPL
jgi:hypothetical protein